MENLLGQLAGNQAIVVKVYDITNSSDPLIMYGREYQDGDISLKRVSMLDFGDPFRKHQMICRWAHLIILSYIIRNNLIVRPFLKLKKVDVKVSFLNSYFLGPKQVSSEGTNIMDSNHHCIPIICHWFISWLHDI